MPSTAALPATLPFTAAMVWVKAAVHCGFDIGPLFREVGVGEGVASGADALVPSIEPQALMRLMQRCVEAAQPRRRFPLVAGELFAFSHLPALETFLATSTTVRQSLSSLAWLPAVLPLLKITLCEDDPGEPGSAALLVELDAPLGDLNLRGCFVEMAMAGIHKFARLLLGDALRADRVEFQHDPGRFTKVYEQALGVPVRVGQPRNAAVFPRALLDTPLRGAMPDLNRQAQTWVEQQLPATGEDGLLARIEQTLRREPALLARGIEPMAQRLALHPRTLQRRLGESGVSYSELQASLGAQLARDGLRDGRTRVEALSDKLGFSDRHSFSRAFKRWTGLTPSEWRRREGI